MAEDHLTYELRAVAYLVGRATPTDDPWLGNAVLDAFLVHVRVLDDFLGKKRPRGEDVLATDCCPEWEPTYALKRSVRNELDRRVTHLTLRHTTDYAWAKPQLARAVMARFKEFMAALSSEYPERAAWIEPVFGDAEKAIGTTAVSGWPKQPVTPDRD